MAKLVKEQTIAKVVNYYNPPCNNRLFNETIQEEIDKNQITYISPKKECTACELAFDTPTKKSTIDGDLTLTFDHKRRLKGQNTGFMVQGQNLDRCEVLFIGSCPGILSAEYGIPFLSTAGLYLRRLIRIATMHEEEKGLQLSKIGFTNMVHCKTLNNGAPKPNHIDWCKHKINEDLNKATPYLIVTVGKMPAIQLLNNKDSYRMENGEKFKKRFRTTADHHGEQMFPGYYKHTRVIPIWDPQDWCDAKHDNEAKALSIEKRLKDDLEYVKEVYAEIIKSGTSKFQNEETFDW